MVEDGIIVDRIFFLDGWASRPPLDVGQRPQPRHTPSSKGLRGDARGRDGGVRQELAEGVDHDSGRAGANHRALATMGRLTMMAYKIIITALLLSTVLLSLL